jgi:hypothetical protein
MEQKNYFGEKLHIPEYPFLHSDSPTKMKPLFSFTMILEANLAAPKSDLTLNALRRKQPWIPTITLPLTMKIREIS